MNAEAYDRAVRRALLDHVARLLRVRPSRLAATRPEEVQANTNTSSPRWDGLLDIEIAISEPLSDAELASILQHEAPLPDDMLPDDLEEEEQEQQQRQPGQQPQRQPGQPPPALPLQQLVRPQPQQLQQPQQPQQPARLAEYYAVPPKPAVEAAKELVRYASPTSHSPSTPVHARPRPSTPFHARPRPSTPFHASPTSLSPSTTFH